VTGGTRTTEAYDPAMRAMLIAAASALILVTPATAGAGGRARVSGRYRVAYTRVAGHAVAAGTNRYSWSAFPECSTGACTTQVRSLYEDGTLSANLLFTFDGTTYEWSQRVARAVRCVDPKGKGPPIAGAYDASIVTRFHVTKVSASGRALALSGSSVVRFLPNTLGRAHGCGASSATERLNGSAITAS
jgi:hypothetical protein